MSINAKKKRSQLWDWIIDKIGKFSAWCKPDPDDSKWIQIGKSMLKIPIILFVLACSPVMLIIAGLIFFLLNGIFFKRCDQQVTQRASINF